MEFLAVLTWLFLAGTGMILLPFAMTTPGSWTHRACGSGRSQRRRSLHRARRSRLGGLGPSGHGDAGNRRWLARRGVAVQ